ncbi:MAG: hypothetical protein AAFQ50_16125, partial [Pseudomonadota bacterium]
VADKRIHCTGKHQHSSGVEPHQIHQLVHNRFGEKVFQPRDRMGLDTTAVLVFPGAMDTLVGDSTRLRSLGIWSGARLQPDT